MLTTTKNPHKNGSLDYDNCKSKRTLNKSVRLKSDFLGGHKNTPFACLYHFLYHHHFKKKLESQAQVCKSESFKFIHVGKYSPKLTEGQRTIQNTRIATKRLLNKLPQRSAQSTVSYGHDDKVGVSETYAQPADVLVTACQQKLRTRTETHQLDVSNRIPKSELEPEAEREHVDEQEEQVDDAPYHEIYRRTNYSTVLPPPPYYYSDVISSSQSLSSTKINSLVSSSSSSSSVQSGNRNNFLLSILPLEKVREQENSQNRINSKAHSHSHNHYECDLDLEEVKKVENNWIDYNCWYNYRTKEENRVRKCSGIEIEVNPLESLYIRHNHKNLNPPNSIRHRKRRRRKHHKEKKTTSTRKDRDEIRAKIIRLTPITCHHHLNCCNLYSQSSNNNNYYYCCSSGCYRSRLGCSDFDSCHYPSCSQCSMARKRYETAFLPSNTNNDQSPDVDSLLLAIESTSLVDQDVELQGKNDIHQPHPIIMRHTSINNEYDCDPSIPFPNSSIGNITRPLLNHCHVDHQIHLGQAVSSKLYHHQPYNVSSTTTNSSCSSSPPPPHPLLTPSKQDKRNFNVNIVKGDQIQNITSSLDRPIKTHDENDLIQVDQSDDSHHLNFDSLHLCSPRKLNNPNPNLPLSEPLPIKRYANAHSSRGGKLSACDKRNLTKEYSISSLESLDSTQSEDLQLQTQHFSFSKIRGHGGCLNTGGHKSKLLSPISDKSPLEPKSVQLHGLLNVTDTHRHDNHDNQWDSQHLLNNSSELSNVPWDLPWECPKLRRKLALLADSGISLDLPSSSANSARDFDFHFMSSSNSRPDFFQSGEREYSSNRMTRDYDLESHIGNQPNFSHGDRGNLDLKLPLRKEPDFTQDYGPGENVEERGNYLPMSKPDRGKVWLDFSGHQQRQQSTMPKIDFDPNMELECQDWFHGAVTRSETEAILRPTKEGSFLVRNCESSQFNQYSLSLKCVRGFIHIRIEPNSLGTFSLGDQEFPTVPYLVQHFMFHRLPIKGAEHVKLIHPVAGGWL